MRQKPNFLLITSDQQHWTTLGVLNTKIKTPNLDRLAQEGARFSRAYCPNPTCTPTRASLITGMYPSAHGAWTLGTKLAEDVPTLGEYLRPAGYRSFLIGKAHFQPLASTTQQSSIECQPLLRDLEFWRTFNAQHTPWYGFDHVETLVPTKFPWAKTAPSILVESGPGLSPKVIVAFSHPENEQVRLRIEEDRATDGV